MANFAVNPLNSGTNNFLNPITALTQLATDLVNPGVVGATTNTSGVAPTTGAGGVNAQGSPNRSVQVNSGHYWVNATPSGGTAQTFGVTQDVSQTVTISANASGSTAYDFVYLQLDPTQLANPAATGLGAGSIITSRSTTAYSATGANNGNSNGAIANSILLGVVTVANGAASITNSNITDARVNAGIPKPGLQQTFTKTTDANGWTVYTYPNWTEYRKQVTFNQTISTSTVVTLSSTNLPVGMSTLGPNHIAGNAVVQNNAFDFSWNFEMSSTTAALNITAISNDAASHTYIGWIDVLITTP